jgi:phage-related baseplate assembly protein
VSKEDYIIRTLSLPSKFGKIAKAYIIKDDQITVDTSARISNPNGLNLYTLAYDGNKNLTNLNPATHQNLITYLEEYRMLTDAVNIKDAFVINFGVEFEIIAFKNSNNEQVLLKCINSLEEYFNIDHWQINQPIALNEIYNVIGSVEGVQNVENVRLYNKAGIALGYSQYAYDFDSANVDNIIYPSMDLSIFELKYPKADITGRITKY